MPDSLPFNRGEPDSAATSASTHFSLNQPLAYLGKDAETVDDPQQSPMALDAAEVKAMAKDSASGSFVDRLTEGTPEAMPPETY